MKRILSIFLLLIICLCACAKPEPTPLVRKINAEVEIELYTLNSVALGTDGRLYVKGAWWEHLGNETFITPKDDLTSRQISELPEKTRLLVEEGVYSLQMYNWKAVAENVVDVAIPGPILYLTDDGDLYAIHDDLYDTPGTPVLMAHNVAAICRTSPQSYITENGEWIIYDKFGKYAQYDGAEGFTGISGHPFAKLASDVRDASGTNHNLSYIDAWGQLWVAGCNDFGTHGNGKYDEVFEREYLANESAGTPIQPEGYDTKKFYKVLDKASRVYMFYKNVFAIRADGSLWSWGANELGTAGVGTHGDGDPLTRDVVTKPQKILDNVIKMDYVFPAVDERTAGNGFLALTSDGKLFSWGTNYHGNLANGEFGSNFNSIMEEELFVDEPTLIMTDIQDYSRVMHAYGVAFFALKNNGDLYAWGNNAAGNVGTGKTTQHARTLTERKEEYMVLTPTKILEDVAYLTDFTSAGAVKKDGSIWRWGYDPFDWDQVWISDMDYSKIENRLFDALMFTPIEDPYISATIGADGTVSFVPTPVE